MQKTFVTVAVIVLTGTVVQQVRQVSRLKDRLAAVESINEQQSQQLQREKEKLSAEGAALREENAVHQSNINEPVRLRGELARLRTAGQNVAVPNSATPVQDKAEAAKRDIPKSSWADAGFGTPEAALRTRGWSVLNGNRDRFKESVFITDGASKMLEDMFVRMAEQSKDPNKNQTIQMVLDHKFGVEDGILMPMMAENRQKGYTGYQILSDQPLGQDERVLQVETTLADGSAKQENLNLRRFAGDWKVVIDEDFVKSAH
jgi:hypothetical protein